MPFFLEDGEGSQKQTRKLLPEERQEKPTDNPYRQYFSHPNILGLAIIIVQYPLLRSPTLLTLSSPFPLWAYL